MKLLRIIQKIDEKSLNYKAFLEQAHFSTDKDSTSFKTTYVKCGAPFFKNALGISAPFNDDYKYRKNVLNEFFPFDLPRTNPRWRTKDKVALIKGVKEQMVSHIKSQQSIKLCEETKKTRGRLQKLKFILHNQDFEESAMIDIYQTIQKDYSDFTINWNLISFKNIQSNHSVAECMGMWFSYLRPDINREPFTDEENKMIAQKLSDDNFNSWNDIAAQLDRRTSLQTFVHFRTTFARYFPSHIRWTDDEDAKLIQLVAKYSINNVINWERIGQILPTRNKIQCYNRYQVIFKSRGLKKGVFSRQENQIILNYIKKYGENAFKKMPKDFLPGRSMVQIKHHYQFALKNEEVFHPWTAEEDKQLMDFVYKEGTNNWRGIGEILKTHNRLSCRTRYLTITKFLSKNKDKTLDDVPKRTLARKTLFQKAAENHQMDDEDIEDITLNYQSNASVGPINNFKKRHPEMLKLFSTTFNYDFSARQVIADNTKLKVLMWLLNFQEPSLPALRPYLFTTNQLLKLHEIAEFELKDSLLNEMKFATGHTHFLLPPNYNTTVGLRALTIKMREESFDAKSVRTITEPSAAYSEALADFQKLFFSLFYWSMMLKKVNMKELNEIHFMKFPKQEMTATEIFQHIKKRQLPVTGGITLKRTSAVEKYPQNKKTKA